MIRSKIVAVMALLVVGIASQSVCHAQADCLQYMIYDDGMGDYLFVTDEYQSDPQGCGNFVGEYYVWVTDLTGIVCPEVCGSGICGPRYSDKDKKVRITSDDPIPKNLPSSKLMLGVKADGTALDANAAGIPNPSAGVVCVPQGFLYISAKSSSIPVKFFKVYLDYKAAGVPKPKWPKGGQCRTLYVGVEVTDSPVTTNVANLTTKKVHSGTIVLQDAGGGGDVHTYHVITKTDLK